MSFLHFFYDTFPDVDDGSTGAAFLLHFTIFKQTVCHLAHETNVEKVFSKAGLFADPNLLPAHLLTLVMVDFNKKVFKPQIDVIKDKYYEMFLNKTKSVTRLLMLLGSRHMTRPAHAGVSGHRTTVRPHVLYCIPTNPGPRSFCAWAVPPIPLAVPSTHSSIALNPGLLKSTNPYPISRDLDP